MNITDHFGMRPDESNITLIYHTDGNSSARETVLNEEHELRLFADGTLLHTFICSPAELGELCAGWLVSEGYTAEGVEVCDDGHTAQAHGVKRAEAAVKADSAVEINLLYVFLIARSESFIITILSRLLVLG